MVAATDRKPGQPRRNVWPDSGTYALIQAISDALTTLAANVGAWTYNTVSDLVVAKSLAAKVGIGTVAPHAILTVEGGVAFSALRGLTTSDDFDPASDFALLLTKGDNGDQTLSLPSVAAAPGTLALIAVTGAGADDWIVDADGDDLIGGDASKTLTAAGDFLFLYAAPGAAVWLVIASKVTPPA